MTIGRNRTGKPCTSAIAPDQQFLGQGPSFTSLAAGSIGGLRVTIPAAIVASILSNRSRYSMPIDKRYSKGDGVPSIPWWRDFADRVRSSAIRAVAPLYAHPVLGGTELEYQPEPEFDGIVMGSSGAGYTVAEAYFNVATKSWLPLTDGRSVTAYEYNLASNVAIGSSVRVRHYESDDWRFFVVRGAASVFTIPCAPCPLPVNQALTLYWRNRDCIPPSPGTATDIEYVYALTWADGRPLGFSYSFKPGFYYSPCIPWQDWYHNPSAPGSACDTYDLSYIRAIFGCRSSDNRLVLMLAVYGFGTSSGDARCADWNPVTGHSVSAPYGYRIVSAWDTTTTCSPFQVRETQYVSFPGVGTGTHELTDDFWIYPT